MKYLSPCLFALLLLLQLACRRNEDSASSAAAPAPVDSPAWAMQPFEKIDSVNPVLGPMPALTFTCPVRKQPVQWAEKDVFNPAVVVRQDTLWMIFRAEDSIGRYAGTSRLGLAWSLDGRRFTPLPAPVLYPANDSLRVYEWEGGCEDPRVVESGDGRYIMTYTAYDGRTARLLVASSRDLRHWEKHGLAFKGGRYRDLWGKSGAIVSRREGNRLIAQPVDGRYWMYWGDKNIHLATSTDLLTWTPVRAGDSLAVALPYRPGFFDSDLVEPGPPALLTPAGILLIYNGRNYGPRRDTAIAAAEYRAGQALFDAADPGRLRQRLDRDFFRPERDYEVAGQVGRVVFLEGLAPFGGEWLLYYGTADSKIAVARYTP